MGTPTPQQIAALEASGEFDPVWYRQENRDVDVLKIDPALHYLIYGHRLKYDPGPNFSTVFARHAWRIKDVHEPLAWLARERKRIGSTPPPNRALVLAAAAAVARYGDHERAIALARRYIPDDLAYTVEILAANAALRQGDDEAWLGHLNAYLSHFEVAPIGLSAVRGSRFARLASVNPVSVTGGPLVSVIMPAWNAAATIEHAAGSILQQSWRNLELLIVDDRSDDDTWAIIQGIAARDDRVRPIRNAVNVGPYVSKNIALGIAKGAWVTGHDADDWALADRIERHVRIALDRGLKASVTDMLRIRENGEVTHLNGITTFCFDGVARRASISCLFDAEVLRRRLGFWDSVRYGGDSEMISRSQALLGDGFAFVHDIGMICLNHTESLTNKASTGVGEIGMSPSRVAYKAQWRHLYTPTMAPHLGYLSFPQETRRHDAPEEMVVPLTAILANLGHAVPAPGRHDMPTTASEPSNDDVCLGGKNPPVGLGAEPSVCAPSARRASEADVPMRPPVDERDLGNFRFRRADGKPFRILARGDCTSFRSVHLNKDLFQDGVEFIQCQKSPFWMLNEAAAGLTVTHEALQALSDVSRMPGALSRHYLGQGDRDILTVGDADLIMLDTWADMNFELWRSNEHGWTMWVHPKFLRDPETFYSAFTNIGRRTLEQSLDEAEHLVDLLRRTNPKAPVLILNQQTDYYPKMDSRREYYTFGARLAERVPDAWFGGVIPRADLETADMDSCGPGSTLHFQGPTYRRMIVNALAAGMSDRFDLSQNKAVSLTASGSGGPDAEQPERLPVEEIRDHIVDAADHAAASGDAGQSSLPFAEDNPERIEYPVRQVALAEEARQSLGKYILTALDGTPTRWTPAVIEVTPGGYAEWERVVNKRYNRVRMKRRSERAGHIVDRFNPRLHVPDMHEIHHSIDVRSGGQMRGNYLKSVEDMGGAPTQYLSRVEPAEATNWVQCFGVFKPSPGHRQGTVEVGRQLLSYISVRRIGEILLYSQLMGHEAYLADGVMYHAHFDIVKEAMESDDPLYAGVRFVMYGGVGNGGTGLWQWKRTAGFVPMRLVTFPWAGLEVEKADCAK